jgi:Leucine-rich repeat (LRR) protein
MSKGLLECLRISSIQMDANDCCLYSNGLKYLTIVRCPNENLSESFFSCVRNLISLKLEHNLLKSLKTKTFESLNLLRDLDLRRNHILSIEKNAFLGLNNLKALDISCSKITRIENGMLNGLSG